MRPISRAGGPASRPRSSCAPCSCKCSTASDPSVSSWSRPNTTFCFAGSLVWPWTMPVATPSRCKRENSRAGLWLGKDRGAHAPSDGARAKASRSDVCADHGCLQPHAHAYLGENPFAGDVRGEKCGKTRLNASKTGPK